MIASQRRPKEALRSLSADSASPPQIVYPPATERFIKNVASTDVTVKAFDDFAHDLYMDTCKENTCGLLIDWVLARSTRQAPAPTGAEEKQQQDPAKL